jgi:hypothetical protein
MQKMIKKVRRVEVWMDKKARGRGMHVLKFFRLIGFMSCLMKIWCWLCFLSINPEEKKEDAAEEEDQSADKVQNEGHEGKTLSLRPGAVVLVVPDNSLVEFFNAKVKTC